MTALIGLGGPTSLALETRGGNQVANDLEFVAPDAGVKLQADAYVSDYPKALHRLDTVSITFNCHGLTFGARRTQIRRASEVEKILRDDGYERITLNGISPGDIAIWRVPDTNDIEHSGIVVAIQGHQISILSKWGKCQEAIHSLQSCPYDGTIEYYRITT